LEFNVMLYVIILVFLFFLSAFFSGSETAFFSLSELSLERLRQSKSKKSHQVIQLLSKPRRLLITILVGNTIVNVAAASIAALVTYSYCHTFGLSERIGIVIEMVAVTFILLIFCEISPKILAVRRPENFCQRVSLPISIISVILSPISILLSNTVEFLTGRLNLKERFEEKSLVGNELDALLELGQEQGELEADEREMIHSIFEFGETEVREVMVPRTDMVCVDTNIKIQELIELVESKGFTRIPMYDNTIDNIRGIIHAKDLLPIISSPSREKVSLLSLSRPCYFVPESKKINELFREFQKEKLHMAIVVDEYGGTAGLVTLEDIIEEIVGEIQDEYDKETPLYRRIDDNTLLVDAKIGVDQLNEVIDIRLPDEEGYETLGGFILNNMGYVPKQDETISYGHFDLMVKSVEKNRILEVEIVQKSDIDSEELDGEE
jgi:putative hemolysin